MNDNVKPNNVDTDSLGTRVDLVLCGHGCIAKEDVNGVLDQTTVSGHIQYCQKKAIPAREINKAPSSYLQLHPELLKEANDVLDPNMLEEFNNTDSDDNTSPPDTDLADSSPDIESDDDASNEVFDGSDEGLGINAQYSVVDANKDINSEHDDSDTVVTTQVDNADVSTTPDESLVTPKKSKSKSKSK